MRAVSMGRRLRLFGKGSSLERHLHLLEYGLNRLYDMKFVPKYLFSQPRQWLKEGTTLIDSQRVRALSRGHVASRPPRVQGRPVHLQALMMIPASMQQTNELPDTPDLVIYIAHSGPLGSTM